MALVFRGKSKCGLCDQIISESDTVISFPPFLPSDHKFGKFSDAAFHETCFTNFPDHDRVNCMYMAYQMIWDSRPKDLEIMEEIEAWHREAFKDWPPKNGVVIFQPLYPDESDEGGFYMDEDNYNEMIAAEEEDERKREEVRKRQDEEDRNAWRYARDD